MYENTAFEDAPRLCAAVVNEYLQEGGADPAWWYDINGDTELLKKIHGEDPRDEFYWILEIIKQRHPDVKPLLFELESAASKWATGWGDIAFLLGQAMGKWKSRSHHGEIIRLLPPNA